MSGHQSLTNSLGNGLKRFAIAEVFFFLIARLADAVFKKTFCNQTRNRPNEKSCSRRIFNDGLTDFLVDLFHMSFLSAGSLSKCLPGASGAIALETSPTAQVFIRVALDSPGLEASAGRQCGSVVPCRSRYCSLGTPALIFKSALVSKGIKTLDST